MYLKQFKIINNINKTNTQKILPRPCKKNLCLHMHKGLSMHSMCVYVCVYIYIHTIRGLHLLGTILFMYLSVCKQSVFLKPINKRAIHSVVAPSHITDFKIM